MKEKPIIFSSEMVNAILENRKTQTRRIIKPQPEYRENESVPDTYGTFFHGWNITHPLCNLSDYVKYAKYQVGDRLWVREGWRCTGGGDLRNIIYKADGDSPLSFCGIDDGRKAILHVPKEYWKKWDYYVYESKIGCEWRPSIHMPKWAARIWLEVTGIRVERLQDISEEDAKAEGISTLFKPEDIGKPGIGNLGGWKNYLWHGCAKGKIMEEWKYQYSNYKDPRLSFSSLWQTLNAKRGYSWESNPRVWVIEFKRINGAK